MGFRSLFNDRTGATSAIIGKVLLSATYGKEDKHGTRRTYVTHKFRLEDIKAHGFALGDKVDIQIDEVARLGRIVKSPYGRTLTGDTTVYLKMTWRPGDPCVTEDVICEVLPGDVGTLNFSYPSSVSFDNHNILAAARSLQAVS